MVYKRVEKGSEMLNTLPLFNITVLYDGTYIVVIYFKRSQYLT